MPNYVTPSNMGFNTTSPIGYVPGSPGDYSGAYANIYGFAGAAPPSGSSGGGAATGATLTPGGTSPPTSGGSATGLPTSTTAGNIAAGPNLQSLSNLINSINQNAQQVANQGRIPNDPALEAASSANIGSELSGQLPADVMMQLNQAAAERGVSTGSPGSDNSNAAALRALGLTSLDLTGRGQSDLSAAVGRNPAAPIFDPTTQLLTPYQAGNLQNQANMVSLDYLRALLGGGGGGGGNQGGGGSGQPNTGTSANDNAWWNSLFPAGSAPGVPTAGGSGNAYTSTTTTTPSGSSYTSFNDPNWDSYFTDTSGSGVPPNTTSTDTSSSYDPFSQYGSYTQDTSGYNDPFNQEMFYSGF